MDYDVDLDDELTLFVGKNNVGKTSLMNLMDMIVSGSNLVFDDYPIQCRQNIYQAFADFWCGKISFEDCDNRVPITMMRLCIDYSKESETDYLGGLSPFIIGATINGIVRKDKYELPRKVFVRRLSILYAIGATWIFPVCR